MALLHNDTIRSRSAISLAGARSMALLLNPLADARSMALLHNDTIRSRSAISLAGARSMALLHHARVAQSLRSIVAKAPPRLRSGMRPASQLITHYFSALRHRCATVFFSFT
jgi:hypothetical protein